MYNISQPQVEEFLMFMAAAGVAMPGNPSPDFLNMSRTAEIAGFGLAPRQQGMHLRIANLRWTEPLLHGLLAYALFAWMRHLRFGSQAIAAYKSTMAMIPGVAADGQAPAAPNANSAAASAQAKARLKAKVLAAQRAVSAERRTSKPQALTGTKPIGSSSRLN